MKKLAILLFMFFALAKLQAQVAVGYYPFQSILSVSTNTEKLFWADLRVETNTFFSNMNTEISPMWNFKRTNSINYYIGAGLNFNPSNIFQNLDAVNGYAFDFGVRLKPLPFQHLKNVQVMFEISPYFNTEFTSGKLRTLLGFAYNFNN